MLTEIDEKPFMTDSSRKKLNLQVTSVSKQVKLPENIPAQTVQRMNKAAILLCQ